MGIETDLPENKIYYPPGGILMWLILLVELLTVFIYLIYFTFELKSDLLSYYKLIDSNNVNLAIANTFVLLLSGYFIKDIGSISDRLKKAQNLSISIGLSFLFISIKVFEYNNKIENNLYLTTNYFFTSYWLLTLFHLLHVILATLLMIHLLYRIIKNKVLGPFHIESVSLFWHMCDFIWIMLIPFLYGFYNIPNAMAAALIFFLLKSFIIFNYFIRINKAHKFWQFVALIIVSNMTLLIILKKMTIV